VVIWLSWSMSAPGDEAGLARGEHQALEALFLLQAIEQRGKAAQQLGREHVHGAAGLVEADQTDAAGVHFESDGILLCHGFASFKRVR
jgi:hypothetical protein